MRVTGKSRMTPRYLAVSVDGEEYFRFVKLRSLLANYLEHLKKDVCMVLTASS